MTQVAFMASGLGIFSERLRLGTLVFWGAALALATAITLIGPRLRERE